MADLGAVFYSPVLVGIGDLSFIVATITNSISSDQATQTGGYRVMPDASS